MVLLLVAKEAVKAEGVILEGWVQKQGVLGFIHKSTSQLFLCPNNVHWEMLAECLGIVLLRIQTNINLAPQG